MHRLVQFQDNGSTAGGSSYPRGANEPAQRAPMGSYLDLEEFTPFRIIRLGTALSNRARDVYKRKHRITVAEWRTLASIGYFGRVTAKTIGRHASMHKSKVSRAVTALENRRWIKRETNKDDRREEFLTLSGAGRKAYEEIVPDLMEFERKLRQKLGPKVAEEFLQFMCNLENSVLGGRRRAA